MSGQRKEFIVLAIADRGGEGFDETGYVRLLDLIAASAPDARVCSPTGVVAFYLRSSRAIAAVEHVIGGIEMLRDSDQAFSSVGIGLAHGPLIGDFDWRGRVKSGFVPVGVVANSASRASCGAQIYRDGLSELHELQET